MDNKKNNTSSFAKNLAFTIAEVLIVLGIIGIVAEITIPALIKNYQKEVTIVKLKKCYSEIYQAIRMAEVNKGTSENWSFIGSDLTSTTDFATNYFYPYIKTSKQCDHSDNSCWTTPITLGNTASSFSLSSLNYTLSAITLSGYSIFFYTGTNSSIYFVVDIDGPNKGKNQLAKDVFIFVFAPQEFAGAKKGLNGYRSTFSRSALTSLANGICKVASTTDSGANCTSMIILDGWQIADDYPW